MEYSELLGTMSDGRLAELIGRPISFVWRARTRLGIKPYKAEPSPRRRYKVEVFDEINSSSAYWLGYYFADGCVCATGHRRLVSFSSCDVDVIQRLVEFYCLPFSSVYQHPLPNGKTSYRLQLCNNHLFERLVCLGCIPKKSLILSSPKIDEEYIPSFLMGYFDGDGSISLNKSINSWKASMGTGSEMFHNWICSWLRKHEVKFSMEKRTTKNGDFYIQSMCGTQCKKFLDMVYSSVPDDLPMDRKKRLYSEMSKNKFRKK